MFYVSMLNDIENLNWSFFIEIDKSGNGKNPQTWFFLLGLNYTLDTVQEFFSNFRINWELNWVVNSTFWWMYLMTYLIVGKLYNQYTFGLSFFVSHLKLS